MDNGEASITRPKYVVRMQRRRREATEVVSDETDSGNVAKLLQTGMYSMYVADLCIANAIQRNHQITATLETRRRARSAACVCPKLVQSMRPLDIPETVLDIHFRSAAAMVENA